MPIPIDPPPPSFVRPSSPPPPPPSLGRPISSVDPPPPVDGGFTRKRDVTMTYSRRLRRFSPEPPAMAEDVGDGGRGEPPSIEEEPAPFSDAPSPVRAVLNRPWPAPVVVPPSADSHGKFRTLLATAKDIGPPISPEELAALQDKDGDDMCTSSYKAAARMDAWLRNYVHDHGVLYQDDKGGLIIDIPDDKLKETCRKNVTAEELKEELVKKEMIGGSVYLSNLALATYNKRRKVKFELCKPLLCRSFWEDRGFFNHINFVAKCRDKKKLFFAEIEDCDKQSGEIFKVRCCVPLDSVSEGGYHELYLSKRPGFRKGLDFDKCYACNGYLKHPTDGLSYFGGHDSQKKTYLFQQCFTCDDPVN